MRFSTDNINFSWPALGINAEHYGQVKVVELEVSKKGSAITWADLSNELD